MSETEYEFDNQGCLGANCPICERVDEFLDDLPLMYGANDLFYQVRAMRGPHYLVPKPGKALDASLFLWQWLRQTEVRGDARLITVMTLESLVKLEISAARPIVLDDLDDWRTE